MGARQSKRVDISGTPKKGEVENGAVAGTEEKLEKIEEGETVAPKVNANGSTTTTSTVTAEQQEAATASTETGATVAESTPSKVAPSETEAVVSEKSPVSEEVSSPTTEDDKQEASSPASPTEAATEEEPGSEKKKKPKKRWSFRSFSFSKKDKQKPASKEEKQQETVPEANENAPQAEQTGQAADQEEQEPPPLPKSPPPTPAEEVPTVAAVVAPVAAAPEKDETPTVSETVSEGDVDASGGGEGLAEPIEDGELEESTTPAAPVTNGTPLTNGTNGTVELNGSVDLNGTIELNGKLNENEESVSPVCERKASVDSVTAKIGSLKLQIASDNAESPAQNGVEETSPLEFNGSVEKNVPSAETAVVEN